MPSLKALRMRINSVKSTQKITSAMKMVAASKLRRAQQQAEMARPYAHSHAAHAEHAGRVGRRSAERAADAGGHRQGSGASADRGHRRSRFGGRVQFLDRTGRRARGRARWRRRARPSKSWRSGARAAIICGANSPAGSPAIFPMPANGGSNTPTPRNWPNASPRCCTPASSMSRP